MGAKRGVVLIYSSLLVAFLFGLVTSSLNARLLSVADFGAFRFIQSAIAIVCAASSFGLLSTCGVLMAGRASSRLRMVAWSGALAHSLFMGLLILFSTFVVLFLQTDWWARSSYISTLAVGFSFFSSISLLFQERCRAVGDYLGIFALNAFPPLLYAFGLACVAIFSEDSEGVVSLLLFLAAQMIVCVALGWRAKVSFEILKGALIFLWRKNRVIGLNVYWASFLAVVSAQAGVLSLQFLSSSESVAKFSLALTITMPLTMLPGAVGTAYFSKLGRSGGFPPKVLLRLWLVMALVLAIFCAASPLVVVLLYGEKYQDVGHLAMWCAGACILHGMGDVYNRYYLANKQTKMLLRVAAGMTIISVFLSAVMGWMYGEWGGVIGKFLSSGFYVLALIFFYHIKMQRFAK